MPVARQFPLGLVVEEGQEQRDGGEAAFQPIPRLRGVELKGPFRSLARRHLPLRLMPLEIVRHGQMGLFFCLRSGKQLAFNCLPEIIVPQGPETGTLHQVGGQGQEEGSPGLAVHHPMSIRQQVEPFVLAQALARRPEVAQGAVHDLALTVEIRLPAPDYLPEQLDGGGGF